MALDIKSGVVAILNNSGNIAGTGFLAGEDLVITCAHVVASADAYEGDTVKIRWEIDSSISMGLVLPENWTNSQEFDIAILRIDKKPAGANPLPLGSSTQSASNSFLSFGYAKTAGVQGLMSKGEILGIVQDQGRGLIQLDSNSLDRGMSGAPIIDTNLNTVIGMVAKGNTEQGRFSDTSFAIPSEIIVKICPELVIVSSIKSERSVKRKSTNKQVEPATSNPSSNVGGGQVGIIQTIRQITIDDNSLDKHAATDKPVENIEQDKLGFKDYVNALHAFVISQYTTTPLTIAVDGQWGTGKSSLMLMLKNRLEPQKRYITGIRSKLTQWGWLLNIIWAFPLQLEGKVFAWLAIKNKNLAEIAKEITQGLSISLDVIQQLDAKMVPDRVLWWAKVHARCEPMEPLSHPTVWLNAWKFDNQDEVWASLALATMEQIKHGHNLPWRLWFWWDLTFSRLSAPSALWEVFKQFLLPLLFALVASFYDSVIGSFDAPIKAFLGPGEPLLWTGFVISGVLKVAGIFKDPFQISLDKVFDRPNYKEKVGFLTHFERDFAKIVQSATKNGWGWKRSKLIVFIDDLDRCKPPKAADVIEAINLFLDAEGCVFVIGMDSEAVAMSVEVKYKDLFERMKVENAGVVSLGKAFLEKIVQIPFFVPRPTAQQITNMVDDTLGSDIPRSFMPTQTMFTPISGSPNRISIPGGLIRPPDYPPGYGPEMLDLDPASYARDEVRTAIKLGTNLLSENPRQVKTFINLFRLSIYIANERKVLQEREVSGKLTEGGLNLNRLAVWVVCAVRWQSLIKHLYADTQVNSLCMFLSNVTQNIMPDYKWTTDHKNVPEEIKKKFENIRKTEKGSEAHWCHLPWDWWLLEPDFLQVVKRLEYLWAQPGDGEVDELRVLLNMSRPLSAVSGNVANKNDQ